MIPRLLLAAFGAVAITVGLLLLMDDVTSRYILRDPTQYFRITDYIPAPDRGRQLPDVPVVPQLAPGPARIPSIRKRKSNRLTKYSPWELPEEAAPNLEEQLILDERQAALPGGKMDSAEPSREVLTGPNPYRREAEFLPRTPRPA